MNTTHNAIPINAVNSKTADQKINALRQEFDDSWKRLCACVIERDSIDTEINKRLSALEVANLKTVPAVADLITESDQRYAELSQKIDTHLDKFGNIKTGIYTALADMRLKIMDMERMVNGLEDLCRDHSHCEDEFRKVNRRVENNDMRYATIFKSISKRVYEMGEVISKIPDIDRYIEIVERALNIINKKQ
jgi:hypothetical protein